MLFLAFQVSCVPKKNIIENDTTIETSPKLIFLNYTISKDDNNKKSIQFINKTITDGKLKSNSNKYIKIGGSGDLKCSQLNKDSVEVTSVIIKNPLLKIIEFVNDSLIFENKKIDLQKTSFSLRLQLHSKTTFIAIKEIKDSLQNSNTLIITKLDKQ
tara:strand:- start:26678 stop:27148 length:471 start_codon:yes stop_codon:yes gene_type:complete